MKVKEASARYVRNNFADTIDQIAEGQVSVAITRHWKVKAYLVSREFFKDLIPNKKKPGNQQEKAKLEELLKKLPRRDDIQEN